MAATVGRLQRVLWPQRSNRPAPGHHSDDLEPLDAYEPVNALVAERDGDLIGLVHYIFHRTTTSIAPTCYLQDLFTAGNARGTGAGRALIEAVYERAKAAGSARVYWLTHETNNEAMLLYDRIAERSGFVQYRHVF